MELGVGAKRRIYRKTLICLFVVCEPVMQKLHMLEKNLLREVRRIRA